MFSLLQLVETRHTLSNICASTKQLCGQIVGRGALHGPFSVFWIIEIAAPSLFLGRRIGKFFFFCRISLLVTQSFLSESLWWAVCVKSFKGVAFVTAPVIGPHTQGHVPIFSLCLYWLVSFRICAFDSKSLLSKSFWRAVFVKEVLKVLCSWLPVVGHILQLLLSHWDL